MDEILARVKDVGLQSLSPEERGTCCSGSASVIAIAKGIIQPLAAGNRIRPLWRICRLYRGWRHCRATRLVFF